MKILPVTLQNRDQLVDVLLTHLDSLPGHPRILEKDLKTDYGSVLLAAEGEDRLVVILPSVEEDDTALVRALAIRGWLKRHGHLFGRLFGKKGFEFTQEIRLLLVAPGFSREMEDAVKGTRLEVELYRFRALNVNRQLALFMDPLFHPKTPETPSPRMGPSNPQVSSQDGSRVTLSAEEKRFFSIAETSN